MPSYRIAYRIYSYFDKHPGAARALYISFIAAMIILGIYLRALPAIKYSLEFYEADSFIEYWQANYTYHHGLLSWYTLTRENNATQLFWYPWGRDFIYNSYPGIPLWTAMTYHVARYTGLSLKDWTALQPLVFAFISYITLILAVKQLTNNNKFAVASAAAFNTLLPAASDRTIVGFVEKTGIAVAFIFLAIYFYSKLARIVNDNRAWGSRKLLYTVLTALSIAMVGWFWGGYVYFLGAFVAFIVLYPVFNPRAITLNYLLYHYLLVALAIVFVVPSPANLVALGLLPFRARSLGIALLASLALPAIFYLLANSYKRFGLRKPILNRARYFTLLVIVAIAGVALYALGYIPISARFAWALGLRAITPAPPLVQSIAEHQSPLSDPRMVYNMLESWGSGLLALFVFSPLAMAVIGALYLIYRGGIDEVFIAVAFLLAFYAYLNAAYMEATASATGIVVASVFTGFIASKILPRREEVMAWAKGRARAGAKATAQIATLIITLLLAVNVALSGINHYEERARTVPTILAGGAPIAATTKAWVKTVEFLKNNLSDKAVVVSWWDYGYWISVAGGRKSVADGATLNSTQISILAKILTSKNETEMFNYMRMLRLPPNDTYLLTFDVFVFIPDQNKPNTYVVIPYPAQYSMVGMVDIPKSVWMVRIGGRNIADYFYVYYSGLAGQIASLYVSPRFDQPQDLPLIYKVMVDGILALSEFEANKTFEFMWYTGSLQTIAGLKYSYPQLSFLENSLGVKYAVSIEREYRFGPDQRPFKNYPYIKPYMIIAEPFEGVHLSGNAVLVEVVFIYKVTIPEH